jgi:hypothetical protein
LLAVVVVPLLSKNRIVRFWLTGLMLALLPICSVDTDERNLIFVGIGAMGLMAQLLSCTNKTDRTPLARLWRIACWVFVGQFIFAHVVCAPGLYKMKNGYFALAQHAVDQAGETLPIAADGTNRNIVIVNNPIPLFFVGNVITTHALTHQLKSVISLTGGSMPLVITRPDQETLTIRAGRGALFELPELTLKGKKNILNRGDRVDLDYMSVQVLDMLEGQPSAASFRFNVPLEDQSLQWFCWDEVGYIPFTLPAVGETLKLKEAVWNFKKTMESFAAEKKT